MSDFQQDEGITVEGFVGGGKPRQTPAPAVVLEPTRRKPKWWLWSIVIALALSAAAFGVRYYFANREFTVTGEILYRPQIETDDGALDSATQVIPVGGAEIIIYNDLLLDLDTYRSANPDPSLMPPPYLTDPPRFPTYASLSTQAKEQALRKWQSDEYAWNNRSNYCSDDVLHARKPRVVSQTYADARGQFSIKLKPGTYAVFASSYVPTFVSSEGKLSPASGFAFWQTLVTVTGETKLVVAAPACPF
jgi:hypothetical protein